MRMHTVARARPAPLAVCILAATLGVARATLDVEKRVPWRAWRAEMEKQLDDPTPFRFHKAPTGISKRALLGLLAGSSRVRRELGL